MTQFNDKPISIAQSVDDLQKLSVSLLRSAKVLHWIGYGLLLLTLFDYIEIAFDPSPKNSLWAFQAVGNFVERVPVPLIGLGLAFYIGRNFRSSGEIILLKVLSWLALLGAVFYLLLIPLGVISTVRIEQTNATQYTNQVEQGLAQVEQAQSQLDAANTPEELQQLLSALSNQGNAPQIEDNQQLQETKTQFNNFIAAARENVTTQAETNRSTQRMNLLRRSVKWNLGALISATLFFIIWKTTSWVR